MTEQCLGSVREDGRHPAPTADQPRMADRVDGAVHAMQPPRSPAPIDRSAPESQLDKLSTSDDAMLAGSELGGHPIGRRAAYQAELGAEPVDGRRTG